MLGHEVLSHWYQRFDGFQHSPQAFYAALEVSLAARQIPDARTSRVEFTEAGVLSATREYLRVQRHAYTFDICAAPFGSGFFVSWWFVKPSRRGLLYAFLVAFALFSVPAGMVAWSMVSGLLAMVFDPLTALVIGTPATIVLFVVGAGASGYAVRTGFLGLEDDVLALPVLGVIYQWIFKPFTYYRIDTEHMFQSAVHAAVLEVVDGLTTTQGIRALSESERKPILRELAHR